MSMRKGFFEKSFNMAIAVTKPNFVDTEGMEAFDDFRKGYDSSIMVNE